MIALELTEPDGEKIMFNWDNVIAITDDTPGFQRRTQVRVRDGSIYKVKESVADIKKHLIEFGTRLPL